MNGGAPQSQISFGSVFDALKVLGASLTGITAILTAAGFLAERARLAMLGLPSATFDLGQYAETGAFFLALLPLVMGIALLLILVSWLQALPGTLLTLFTDAGLLLLLILVVGGAAAGIYWALRRWRKVSSTGKNGLRSRLTIPRGRLRRMGVLLVLAAALLLQIHCVAREVSVLDVQNVLFATEQSGNLTGSNVVGGADTGGNETGGNETGGAEPGASETGAAETSGDEATHDLTGAVVGRGEDATRAVRLFGEIVLFTVLNAAAFYYVVRRRLGRQTTTARRGAVWAWSILTGLLLVSQVTLMPVSYGVLLSRNNYQEVCAVLASDSSLAEVLPDTRLALVQQTGDGFHLYSRAERAMWYVQAGDVDALVHHARVDILDPTDPEPCLTDDLP